MQLFFNELMIMEEHDVPSADGISFRNPSLMQDKKNPTQPTGGICVYICHISVSVLAVMIEVISFYKNVVRYCPLPRFHGHTHNRVAPNSPLLMV